MIESFASEDEIEGMVKRMEQLVDDFDPSSTASIFSTKNQVLLYLLLLLFFLKLKSCLCSHAPFLFQQKLTDDYFFDSVERVSFFFEGIAKIQFFSVLVLYIYLGSF